MPQPLLTYAPFMAVAALVLAVVLLLGITLGVGTPMLMIVILAGVTAGLGGLSYLLIRQGRRQAAQIRALLPLAERAQAVLASAPTVFCLFTPQGILRESVGVAALLGVEKVAHAEDLVAAIRDPELFLAAFRKLQLAGEGFALSVTLAQSGTVIPVTGKRVRIGRDSVPYDVLWFDNSPAVQAERAHVTSALAENKASVEQLTAMRDSFPLPIWIRQADLTLTGCNPAYARIMDQTVAAVLEAQSELTSATARGGSGRALAAKALETGQPQIERRHVIVAGKRQLLEITEIPYSPTPETRGVFGFAVNVTAEEEQALEIERHATSQREVLEHLGSAIAIYGPDTRLEFYNRAYVRLWHATEAFLDTKPTFGEIIEDSRTRRVAPEQSDFPRYKRERVGLFTSLLEPREDLMHLPDGTTLRILVSPHPMGGLIFVHEDVTDRLELESSYNTLIAVQRETIDNLAEGVAVFGTGGKLGLFNQAVAQIWNLPTDYLASSPHIADFVERARALLGHEADWESFKKDFVSRTLDRTPRKTRLNLTNGQIIDCITAPLPDGAALNSYLDVTDSVKIEQALRASNAALAAADRVKSDFVATVSHQLRTPLNTIMGFSEILTNQYFGSLNDRQMEYTRTIMEASKKLLLLINDVLDLATIEAGRMTLNREAVLAANLMNAARQVTAEWARQQALEVAIDCPSDVGSFTVDAARIKQVLLNLLNNAITWTLAGGRITLEARRASPWIILSVVDTGVGIPPDSLDRVFGKFERGDPEDKKAGAGLGLSLVKSLIELHGGRVEITSTPDTGTRISCFVPIYPPAAG